MGSNIKLATNVKTSIKKMNSNIQDSLHLEQESGYSYVENLESKVSSCNRENIDEQFTTCKLQKCTHFD